MDLTKDQLAEWKSNLSTREIFKILNKDLQEMKNSLLQEGTLSRESVEATAINTAHLLGEIRGLEHVLNFIIEDEEIIND